jgi:LPXTG-motif cell wall-anchored protein
MSQLDRFAPPRDSGSTSARFRQEPPAFAFRGAAIMLVLTMLIAMFSASFALLTPGDAADAAENPPVGCGYGTGGPQAANLCWLDLSGYDETAARSATGQPLSITLPGGYVATFNIVTTTPAGATPRGVVSAAFPTLAGVPLGTTAYVGTPGRPALYQVAGAGSNNTVDNGATVIALENIRVVDSLGVPVTGYGLAVADAEATANQESLTWTSDQPLELAAAVGASTGNADCFPNLTGIGTTTVSCDTPLEGTQQPGSGGLTSTVLSADSPTRISISIGNVFAGNREAVAFAFQTSRLTVNKAVDGRVNASDAFTVGINSPEGSLVGSAATGSADTATTGGLTVLPRQQGSPYVLTDAATPDTGTLMANYDQSWSCVNATTGSATAIPAATGTTQSVSPQPGDDITCTVTNTAKAAELALTKRAGAPVDANANGITDEGDTIAYTFDVTNSGALEMSDITIADPKVGAVTCPSGPLAPGATVTCTAAAPYTITAADASAGSVDNTATASGTPPGSTTPVDSDPSTTTTPTALAAPSLTIDKTASPDDAASFTVGRQITYSFLVTNTGNVPLDDIDIDEQSFTGSGTISEAVCPSTSLAVNTSVTCTASYTVTQADVDNGSITNAAIATGTPPGSTTPVPSAPDTVLVPAPNSPSIAVVKTADPSTITAAGQPITYSFTATNTGNVTLTDVAIDEGAFSGTGTLSAATCDTGAASLAPGATVRCTATYTATQADVDAGSITNTATAMGTTPTGVDVISDPSTAIVTAPAAPAITVVKSADPASITAAGETVTYSFVVTNSGNVTLTDATVNEGAFSGTGTLSPLTYPESRDLAPGETLTARATYVATQADVDAGSITNTATASGTPPVGDPVQSDPSSAIVTAGAIPGLTMVKSAAGAPVEVGDTITYSFLFTNTGNVRMDDLTVNEGQFSGTGTLSEITYPTRTLAPGETTTATATYVTTQADVDAGRVTNTATGSGTPPVGPPTETPTSPTDVPIPPAPGLTVVKSASATDAASFKVGEEITYSFVLTNTGNTTLTDVTVIEGQFSGTGTLSEITYPTRTLAPGESTTATATYVLTQGDIDAGTVRNSATAQGTPPGKPPVDSPPSESTVPFDPAPSLTTVKTASLDAVTTAGQVVTYSFLVTNTGNMTLRDVTVDEGAFSGTGALSAITYPKRILAPGESLTATATYTVTDADLRNKTLTNTASSSGIPPTGPQVESPPSTVTVGIPPVPVPAAPVTPVGAVLAYTGSEGTGLLVAGGITLLLIGGGLMLMRRRRQEAE